MVTGAVPQDVVTAAALLVGPAVPDSPPGALQADAATRPAAVTVAKNRRLMFFTDISGLLG
jgi:hypothetical protein